MTTNLELRLSQVSAVILTGERNEGVRKSRRQIGPLKGARATQALGNSWSLRPSVKP